VNVLSCSVRGCGLPLALHGGRAYTCRGGHSYDVARSGYVNLLQPQDRRSPDAGDSKTAVAARARLADARVGASSLEAIVARAAALARRVDAPPLDIGCGVGDALAMLPGSGIGIDLSVPAIELAARRHPGHTWVVANADRRIPIVDGGAGFAMSLNGRRHPAEASRVLAPDACLLVTVPAPDDLIELRTFVQGEAIERARGDALVAEHSPLFELLERTEVRERPTLDPPQLDDLLRGTYRGRRASEAGRVQALTRMAVTLAAELFVFRRR
jgi:23S rRNA (guanine745-N1)-methyltransferase